MRKPNRKYKVSKQIMAERLEIGWCNVARVRALCLAIHGHDPELENWDQSPFHNNESGSQNISTLAVAGGVVPLIEGHADTRARWTANFTTFSNKARLVAYGPPYCEFCFKADGERTELRLREYIRSRGYGPWVSVITSTKGSYRNHDVLNFLDRHLPDVSQSGQWRIIMADDFAAHTTMSVFNLCWQRGYVFISHGGGVTPVVQTPDTDLNQHAKRLYAEAESAEHVRQMREGACVPRCTPEQCIDIMVEVMSNIGLHLAAADGYLKTGMTVALDGTQDSFIVREAGHFWKELGMREKINAAVAEVRQEVQANRLSWTYANVRRLIRPYPQHRGVDSKLAKLEDDTWIPEGETPYEEEDESSEDEGEEDEDGEGDLDAAVADEAVDESDSAVADQPDSMAAGEAHCAALCALSDGDAEVVMNSQRLIVAYEGAIVQFKAVGAMKAVVNLENEIRKERRKLRGMSKEDPDVLLALARQQDAEDAKERRRLRHIAEANAQTLTKRKLEKQIKDAKQDLKKRKQDVADEVAMAATRHAMKSFSLQDLGHGRDGRSRGGAQAKKNRFEVLDRLSRLCQGLSAAQQNDFSWWKQTWDESMAEHHGENWPKTFAELVQRILDDFGNGVSNAFSVFVHAETRRCFHNHLAVQVP
jgi:hypothetical protein